jgi:uncharacterized coiled-coil protein SlyX
MARQIAPGLEPPSPRVLEERILQLETRVALLANAVKDLTRELERRADAAPPRQ